MDIALTGRMAVAGAGAIVEEAWTQLQSLPDCRRSLDSHCLRTAAILRTAAVLRTAAILRTVAVLRREGPTPMAVLVVEFDQRTRTYAVEGGGVAVGRTVRPATLRLSSSPET